MAGIQYRLKKLGETARVTVSCHRLRHTFARRLVENGLPVDSLAKLLGHTQLKTTQRYIDGADPTVRADFAAAMAYLETTFIRDQGSQSSLPKPGPSPRPRPASQAKLQKLRKRIATLPPWLGEAVDAYISFHWPTWRAQTANQLGGNLVNLVRRTWNWLGAHRDVEGWDTFRRADLQAWLHARHQDGVSVVTIRSELGQLRSLLTFMETRGCLLDPGLFRVKPPKQVEQPLPRYLSEVDYRRLEATVLGATRGNSYDACFDRAWFLTLAHTGLRLSELLGLRVGDLTLEAGHAVVRDGKPGRDRVVYLTPPLSHALERYLRQRPALPGKHHLFLLHERQPSARTIQRRLARYGQQAGVVVSPHRLRHTLATRLINQGMPIHLLRKLLGHHQLSTTQLYARIYDETLYEQFRVAMSQLETIAVEGWTNPHTIQRKSELAQLLV